jgi:hypothetical protein
MRSAGRAVNAVLGGWQLSGIWSAHSGFATYIVSGQNTSFDNRGNDQPDYAQGKHSVSHNNWRNAAQFAGNTNSYLNVSDFVAAAPGTKGGIGRNPTGMFYPGWNNWDLGISKWFTITERARLQFRWEMFNAFNRETFGCMDNNWGGGANPTFGQFSCSTSTPRTMQAALKFLF